MNKRVLEKFEIERVYWERQDIDYGIVTELEVPKYMAHYISFVHSYSDLCFRLDTKNKIYIFRPSLLSCVDNEWFLNTIEVDKKALEREGILSNKNNILEILFEQVIPKITRKTEQGLDQDKAKDLKARCTLANKSNADLVVSIHLNAFNKMASGYETLVRLAKIGFFIQK
ncbi:N-acetylmuramoyl-L-alanine amidase [Domibacillus epiphyticus]|nr:N-acetylmuramoyl-L-alanine amidase [Domibacillus epiphyticus]